MNPEDIERFGGGFGSSQSSMARRLFPIMQYLRALGGADPNEESYRQAGFNAGELDTANAGRVGPRPWDAPVFRGAPGGMAPESPAFGDTVPAERRLTTTADDAMALAEEIKRQKAIAAGLLPEQLWNY